MTSLLPINPPKVDSLIFQGMVNIFEISFAKGWTIKSKLAASSFSASSPKRFATMGKHLRRRECHLLDGHLRSPLNHAHADHVRRQLDQESSPGSNYSPSNHFQSEQESPVLCQSISITLTAKGTPSALKRSIKSVYS